jgi:hypothetical protein
VAFSPYSAAFITAGRDVAYSACGRKGAEKHILENRPSSLEALHICCMKIKVNLFIFLNFSSFLCIVENKLNRWIGVTVRWLLYYYACVK